MSNTKSKDIVRSKTLSTAFGKNIADLISALRWRSEWTKNKQDGREYFYTTIRELADELQNDTKTIRKNIRFLREIRLIGNTRHHSHPYFGTRPSEIGKSNRGNVSVFTFNEEGFQFLLKIPSIPRLETSSEFFELIKNIGKNDPFSNYIDADQLPEFPQNNRMSCGKIPTEQSNVLWENSLKTNDFSLYTTITTKNPSTTFLLSEFENEAPDETQMNYENEDFSLKNTSGKKLTDADFFVVENEFDSLGCVYQFSDNEEIHESKVSSEYELRYETSEFLRNEDMRAGNIQIEEKSSAVVETNDRNISSAKKNLPVSTDSFEYKCAEFIWNQVLKQYDKAKKPDLNRWAKEVSKMIRIDKRDEGEIRRILKFIYSPCGDQFWQTVIQSPTGLRRNFDKIAIKANNASKQPQNQFNGSGGVRVFWTAKEQEEKRYQEKREALYAKWEMQKKDPDYVPVEPMSMDVDLGG